MNAKLEEMGSKQNCISAMSLQIIVTLDPAISTGVGINERAVMKRIKSIGNDQCS